MKILGLGNALVDVFTKLNDESLLQELHLPKGSMNLIDIHTRNNLFDRLNKEDMLLTTGGSAGNTCLAIAHLDMPVGFIGKVGDDDYGKFYVKEYTESGVEPHFIYSSDVSGTALVLITPDGERTFCTYLGVAAEMRREDLREQDFKQYTHLYIEGYLVQNHGLIEGALKMAKSLGLTTALDLASFNVVEEEKEFLQRLIKKYVDIVFSNETEAQALTGKSTPEEAIRHIAEQVRIAVVKTGAEGSWVMQGDEIIRVPVKRIKPVDTTAAGDYYAAGFFYGLKNKASLKQCAEYGSLLAGEIIQVVGTNLPEDIWKKIRTILGN